MSHRVQERGPPVHDRALLDLALDAESERRAFQNRASTSCGEVHTVMSDLLHRHELRHIRLCPADHHSDPVTSAPRRPTYRAKITTNSRSGPLGVRTTPSPRPTVA